MRASERYKEQIKLARQQSMRLMRVPAAMDFFGLGRTKLMKIANDCEAVIEMNNNMVWLDKERIEEYLLTFRK
ncbi:DUF6462 family protein [Butyrivibrio sp. AE3004]|uniref:DUF6462 family protein n=1 Tax=Butyrivibrio sp. AE3004 TaxID=1506994 RepID=UPI0004943E8A|nr:DUF6462 family protein [Butyrivibrio sp. AE3004]